MGDHICQKKISHNDVLTCMATGFDNDDASDFIADGLNIFSDLIRKQKKKHEPLSILIKDDGIHLGDINVVHRKSRVQHATFEILLEHHFLYVMNRCKYEYITVRQIISQLESQYGIIVSHEAQIRRSIKLLKKRIQEKTGTNYVIEALLWKGYRLNPKYLKFG